MDRLTHMQFDCSTESTAAVKNKQCGWIHEPEGGMSLDTRCQVKCLTVLIVAEFMLGADCT